LRNVFRIASAWLVSLVVLAIAAPASARDTVTIDWQHVAPLSGSVTGDTVTVTAGSSGGRFPLAVIDSPPVQTPGYVITGRVSYESVKGRSFLEMWSLFGDGSRYFSRTLGNAGPMAALSGTAGWRDFSLPFQLRNRDAVPARLEIGVVLSGAGTVHVGSLHLVSPGDAASGASQWWSARTAGLAGAVIGTLIGVLGALLGSLTARGRARRLVLGTMTTLAVAGAGLTVAGIAALALSQPYPVWFALLLPGLLLIAILGGRVRGARRAYAEIELRRIRAIDG
jgi:hypothetical protein